MTRVPALGNVAELVRRAAARGGEHPALVDVTAGTTRTWAQLDAAVDAEARRLRALGARPGDRVGVRLPTGTAFCVAVLGALRAGCVVVPMAPGAPERELEHVLTDSGAVFVVGDAPGVSGVPTQEPPDPEAAAEPFEAVGAGEDLAVLAYTSGTSGAPRGAMLPHRALLANVEQCAALRPAPVTAADRVLLAVPLFHAYGLGPGLLQVAASGATAVLMERFDPEEALAVVERHRVTAVVGVPPMYAAWLRLPAERLRAGFTTVRVFGSGAAPLEPDVLAAFRRASGLDVFEGYGLTEAGPVLTSTLVSGRPKPGAVGRPLPGVELRLVDVDGEPLPDGVDMGEDAAGTGLVAARGANLFLGYWPDGAGGPSADGWFRTNDVGYLDADGDLHLVDRAGDLIIVNGFNVYPHEVEHVLCELPGVAEAAAVGVPDPDTGEAVRAVVVPEPGAGLTVERVREHCAARLAKFKVPTQVEFVDELPHTPTGKLARRALR
ncbi:long-chain acyl-CoA synthetase [Streptoalloteichus tenebrarius]|uniref:Long-chain acyl-CoA synthetase n=1 Tax=Streptoalloteichus tenebrarius (strain ATCC 17920 / DSM 40477 / JCM 4838 / CBS 697.72 / NBRC 16177 / NCIMB 11028 / NRRL B-12390 / A12253. 1 / ISP 5477) TaxID=1933 RepID=A0ABT1I1Q0_STRSD|nr:AMP-binding protein [Streptoalloteichus tenebrarius]MCP2261718.1 long-chain acyl-CoA synthetase [Streptoalloteichus tenebrarius]BFF02431.1 long-chain fatty acid--CoA ligase [Streptoalloteichus tenebrarius]